MAHFQTSAIVSCPIASAYAALTEGLPQWWTLQFEGAGATEGQAFTVRFGGTFKSFLVTQLVPPQTVVWHCTQSYLDSPMLSRHDEWNGTQVEWQLTALGESTTQIHIQHHGLTPEVQCYDVCEAGWHQFVQGSLVPYLESGVGAPFGESRSA